MLCSSGAKFYRGYYIPKEGISIPHSHNFTTEKNLEYIYVW